MSRMIKIRLCPICGKKPKVKRDYGYESSGFGAWCTIQCKPLFRKAHLKVEEGKATWEMALEYAAESWNEKAKDIHVCDDCGTMNCKGRGISQFANGNKPFLCKSWTKNDRKGGNSRNT